MTDNVIAAVRALKDDPGDELQIWGSRSGLAVPQKDGRPAMVQRARCSTMPLLRRCSRSYADATGEGTVTVASRIVKYEVDESTVVGFEIEPGHSWDPAGAGDLAGRVRDAVEPAVEAAKAVLGKIKEAGPDAVEVKFGVKVNGEANWIVAKTATEGSFEVTLTWAPNARRED